MLAANRKAASLLRMWVDNRKIKPMRATDLLRLLEWANHEHLFIDKSDFVTNLLKCAAEHRFSAQETKESLAVLKAASALLSHNDIDIVDPTGVARTNTLNALKPELFYRIRFAPRALTDEFGHVATTLECLAPLSIMQVLH